MPGTKLTRDEFLNDPEGREFTELVDDPQFPFENLLEFLNDYDRQRRMEESEIHHDRPPLAGIVRELESESHEEINRYFTGVHSQSTRRLRRAIDVALRMIMERLGWQSNGRKSFLGVRARWVFGSPRHNLRGLSFWFPRGERFDLQKGMPYRSVAERGAELKWSLSQVGLTLSKAKSSELDPSSLEEFAIKAGDAEIQEVPEAAPV